MVHCSGSQRSPKSNLPNFGFCQLFGGLVHCPFGSLSVWFTEVVSSGFFFQDRFGDYGLVACAFCAQAPQQNALVIELLSRTTGLRRRGVRPNLRPTGLGGECFNEAAATSSNFGERSSTPHREDWTSKSCRRRRLHLFISRSSMRWFQSSDTFDSMDGHGTNLLSKTWG